MEKAKLLLIVILLFSELCSSQNLTKEKDSLAIVNFNNVHNKKDFSTYLTSNKYNTLNTYNPTTGLNDFYAGTNSSLSLSGSTVIIDNLHRGTKIDSFNPYGTNNFNFALSGGIFNLIFNKTIKIPTRKTTTVSKSL